MSDTLPLYYRFSRPTVKWIAKVTIFCMLSWRFLKSLIPFLKPSKQLHTQPQVPPKINQSLAGIPFYQYHPNQDKWLEVNQDNAPLRNPIPDGDNLRVVSYNVLSSPNTEYWICSPVRWRNIVDSVLPNLDADVILLNEVSDSFAEMLRASEWVRSSFYVTALDPKEGPRKNLILSRFPFADLYWETVGERKSIIGKINVKVGLPIWICTAHTHALHGYAHVRKAQLDCIYDYANRLSGSDAALIMGDLNFHSEEEHVNIAKPYFDVYRHLNPVSDDNQDNWTEEQKGVTFDTTNNLMVNLMAPVFPFRMRLDRALLKQSTSKESNARLVPKSMFIFGKQPVSPKLPDLFPSDHFGLALDFSIISSNKV